MGICPMYCVPGSAETVKSTDGKEDLPINHGTCLTNADAAAFGDEVQKLPIYKAQGTNDRFDAANNLNDKICSRAKMFEEGWKAGQSTHYGDLKPSIQSMLHGHRFVVSETGSAQFQCSLLAPECYLKYPEYAVSRCGDSARTPRCASDARGTVSWLQRPAPCLRGMQAGVRRVLGSEGQIE